MKYSQRIQNCHQSPIRKFYPLQVAAEERGIRVIHLNIGQPDVKTPKAYFKAIRNFSKDVLEYAPSPGIPLLLNTVAEYYQSKNVKVTASDIIITTGGSEALRIALDVIMEEGAELIVPEPYYPNYATFNTMAGGTVVPVPAGADRGYRFADKELIEAAITPNTRAILFSNPGNPTGVALSEAECRVIANIAKEHDLFIIADEVYREFNYSGKPLVSMACFDDIADRVIVIDSVSKRFSACGARVGSIICRNPVFMKHAMKLAQARLSVATVDQVASAALYDTDPSYFDDMAAEYMKRRDAVVEELSKIPGAKFAVPEGAFYMMVSIPVDDIEKFQTWLLNDFNDNGETIMFAPGPGFYATPGKGKNEFRLAYVICEAELRRAIQILGKAIEEYNK